MKGERNLTQNDFRKYKVGRGDNGNVDLIRSLSNAFLGKLTESEII